MASAVKPSVGVITNIAMDHIGLVNSIDECFGWFPRLKDRKSQIAGTLSGGEQEMLAIARAFTNV